MNELHPDDSPAQLASKAPAEASHSPQSGFFTAGPLDALRRLLIYITAFVVLRYLVIAIVGVFVFNANRRPGLLTVLSLEESLLLLAAFLPARVLSKLERKTLGAYGLPASAAFRKQFWIGAAWGVAAVSVLLLTMRLLGLVDYSGFALQGLRAAKFAVFWGVFFLIVGLYEDFLFRGYSLGTLSQITGFWPAAVVSSLVFGSTHLENKGEGWAGALGAMVIGLFFCLTLRRTGNLWFAIGVHMSWDWSETYLYSVPDSGLVLPGHLLKSSFHGPVWLTGGTVGPEGSVLVLVLIGLMAWVFDWAYPAQKSSTPALPTGPEG